MSDAQKDQKAIFSEDDFIDFMVDVLRLDERPSPSTKLEEDIGLDSIARYELVIAVDEDLGAEVDEEQWLELTTVGDCYASYRAAVTRMFR